MSSTTFFASPRRARRVVLVGVLAATVALTGAMLTLSGDGAASGTPHHDLTAATAGHRVDVALGSTVVIRLKETPSSGAVWSTLAGTSPGTVLVQTGASFTPAKRRNPSGPGSQRLLYVVDHAGTTILVVGEHTKGARYYATKKWVVTASRGVVFSVSTHRVITNDVRFPVRHTTRTVRHTTSPVRHTTSPVRRTRTTRP